MKHSKRIPPQNLAQIQEHFGKSIRIPFSFATGRFQCQKQEYSRYAAERILSRGLQTGEDRLAVYNEQYWYRLLTLLQEDFPLLAHTLGLWEFNQLATAFLVQHPSHSPFLHDLSKGLGEFLRTTPDYNSPRLIQITTLEEAFHRAFYAATALPLDPTLLTAMELESLASQPLIFQPSLSLIEEDWNLMESRFELVERGQTLLKFQDKKSFWAIYRNEAIVEWRPLESGQFQLLSQLYSGQPLESACETMLETLEESEVDLLMAQIPIWFETWTKLKWFAQASFKGLVDG